MSINPVKVIGLLSTAGVSPEVVAVVNARIVLKPSVSISDLLTVLSEAGVTPDEVLAVRTGLEPADAADVQPAAASLVSALPPPCFENTTPHLTLYDICILCIIVFNLHLL